MQMKVKKALLKDTFKEITRTYKRFISILLMALLGVGFFAGLRASSPDMVDSIDSYYKNQESTSEQREKSLNNMIKIALESL